MRQLVAERARYCCEYCLIPEWMSLAPHEIDHIIAIKHGGSSTLDNLAYSCAICNKRKGSDIASYDRATERIVPLFHPRRDRWRDHFHLDGVMITPKTDRGRVTVQLLLLNRATRLAERTLLIQAGELTLPE